VTAYLDPIRDELDRLRTENKQLADAAEHWRTRSHQLTETLRLRTDALNRTGADNDQLRAKVARVETLAKVQAISCQAQHRADHARNWLDVLAILDDQPDPNLTHGIREPK